MGETTIWQGLRCPRCGSRLYQKKWFQFWSKRFICPRLESGWGWSGDTSRGDFKDGRHDKHHRHHHHHRHQKHHRRPD